MQKTQQITKTKQPSFEESFACSAIIKFCEANQIQISNIQYEPLGQSKAPDYSLEIDNKIIALEITLSGRGFNIDNDNIKRRSEVDKPLESKIKLLESEIQLWIKHGDKIMLIIDTSVENPNQFFSLLSQKLKVLYENNNITTTKQKINIKNIFVTICLVHYDKSISKPSPLIPLIIPNLTTSNPAMQNNLQFQANEILIDCITTKHSKITSLGFNENWLAIINEHPLLDLEFYINTIKKLQGLVHCFLKIFIIFDSVAYELNVF